MAPRTSRTFMKLSDEQDLLVLIKNGVFEDLHLDYKDSMALQRSDAKKREISKDVSSFANSDGGQLVYGMVEQNHLPSNLDVGSDPNDITKEWLEQVIMSTIQPRITDVTIHPIPLSTAPANRLAYVVTIPRSISGPHQAVDKRYYKRYNFQSAPMEDYEVRDVAARRLAHPRPAVVCDVTAIGHLVYFVIRNLSDVPAENVRITSQPPLPLFGPDTSMQDLPIFRDGISYLSREKAYHIALGAANALVARSPQPFTIDVDYEYLGQFKIHESFKINLNEYFHTWPETTPLLEEVQKLGKELKQLREGGSRIVSALDKISKSYRESGLALSFGTLHALREARQGNKTRIDLSKATPEELILIFDLQPSIVWKVYEKVLSSGLMPSREELDQLGLKQEQADLILKIGYVP